MHGRDLRARSVASVDEYVDLLGTPQREVPARGLEKSFARYPRLREDIKWHVPVYSLGKTPIVSIEGFGAHVNLKFFDDARLQNRAGILEGTGKGVHHAKFRSTGDVDEATISGLVDEALGRRS